MDLPTIISTIVTGVIVLWVGYILFDRPKITTPYPEGWVVEHKQVNTFREREHSTDIDSYPIKELKTQDYYTFYGITVRNEKWIFPRVEAKITKVNMKVWNSKYEPVTDTYDVRWWNRKHAGIDPLFSGKRQNRDISIGEGEELDLVIAYNQENESDHFRFTIETPTFENFPVYKDKFRSPMPHYAIVRVHGHKINKVIYLRLELGRHEKEMRIAIIPKSNFPSEIKETI